MADNAPEAPLSFSAYARKIGKSQAYISKQVARGVICPPALTPHRMIIPSLADEQMASATVLPKIADIQASEGGTLVQAQLRLTNERADAAELENRVRRGELIERDTLAATLPTIVRRYHEHLAALVRDTITDDVERAVLADAMHDATVKFINEATNGGAPPAA